MESTKWPAISGLVIGTVLLCRSAPTSFAFDKPTHTSIAVLASSAAATFLLSRFLPQDIATSHQGRQYDAVPLEDVGQPHGSREPSPVREDVRYPSSLRKLRILFLVLVAAICIRLETLREILENTQCAGLSWESLIPLILAIWDYWTVQRHRKQAEAEDWDHSVYDDLEGNAVASPYRFLVAAGIVSLSSLLALSNTHSIESTYICASTLHHTWLVPAFQHAGILIDVSILYCVSQLLHQQQGRGHRSVALQFISIGWALLFSAIALFGVLSFYYLTAGPPDKKRLLAMSSLYVWSVVRFDLLVVFTVICSLLTIYQIGIMTTSVIAAFVATSTLTTAYTWNDTHPFPPTSLGIAFLAISLAIIGFATYFYIETASYQTGQTHLTPAFRGVSSWFYIMLLGLFIFRTSMWASHNSTVTYHPIDLLIYDAARHHSAYVNQTSASTTLNEAVANYKERYNRYPPPGFEHWYEYATARNSVVIDDFDSIHRDLLPFNAVSPETIRERTFKLTSNPWHDAAGVSIRNGKADVSPNVVATHRWMIDGLVEMISKFSEHLPDMDLAFNLNDECRVAVPYEQIEPMRRSSRGIGISDDVPRNEFSTERGEQWKTVPEEANDERVLKEMSWQRTFYDFGSIGCPPRSPARKTRAWNLGRLCTSCVFPQSLGAFLGNWSTAADICHQPDLANLHGIYLSPAAFKASHELYPIFSQSKTHGFNDILYPSAWNYLDKARYEPTPEHPDPAWYETNNTLFWRGATSEGVSQGFGQWRGMARQRFVHMANEPLNESSTAPPQPLLVPKSEHRLAYAKVPTKDLMTVLSTDIHIVDTIARCDGRDCPQQAAEFSPLVPPTDFQDHWRYRYLLDLDGAGFSGRFLPFLASHSLPFKAGIFREWWDDRVTPWEHFVPLDIRGQGFWATLAYFAGIKGEIRGRFVEVEGHDVAGERIAERGREWAGKVLRKEDMEIYFFRLLLEWGRLTDDARDSLGMDVEAV